MRQIPMIKVRATDASKKLNVRIIELGDIAEEGTEFSVTPIRFRVLSGFNMHKAKFVEKVEEVQPTDSVEEVVVEEKPKRTRRSKKTETTEENK